jgi:alkylation response protein AidB-like acyl-CoA dehydrogenase
VGKCAIFCKIAYRWILQKKVAANSALTKAGYAFWHAALNARGWLAPNWPKAFGGSALCVMQRSILDKEYAQAHTPRMVPFGIALLGPVLMEFGNDA